MSDATPASPIELEIARRVATLEIRSAASSWLAYGLQACVLFNGIGLKLTALWLMLLAAAEALDLFVARQLRVHLHDADKRRRYSWLLTITLLLSGSAWGASSYLPGLQRNELRYMANFFILNVVGTYSIHNLSLRKENLAAFTLGLLWPTLLQNSTMATELSLFLCLTCVCSYVGMQYYGYGNRKLERKEILQTIEIKRLARTLKARNTELEVAITRIAETAARDPLTQCFNRRALAEKFQYIKDQPADMPQGLGVIIIDVDHFKLINDQKGHDIGDLVLVKLSNKIKSCLRAIDYLGRWGGEEFVCLIPDMNEKSLFDLADRLRQKIADMVIETCGPFHITVSMGLAVVELHTTLEKAVAIADLALYRAKHAGRNQVCI